MPDVVLRLQHIVKAFGSFRAVDDLSLDIYEGEVFSLLGPSGCGKTTTLRLIAGLETPDQGSILLRGKPVVSVSDGVFLPPHKRNMGMVFQSYAIWPHKTVFENVAYPLQVRRVKASEIRQRVMRALETVGLAGLEARQGPQLSGGQQQRVALARALVYEPSILLLDEPFSNLDAKLREQMRVQLKLLLKAVNVTAIFVTHDQAEALSLSDRIALMNNGRVEQLSTPREMYERPATPFVRDFLGHTVLLRGVVDGTGPDGQIGIRVPELSESTIFVRNNGSDTFTTGQPVVLAIRPEDVQLAPSAAGTAGPNEFLGAVEAALFLGDHQECQVKLGATQVLSLHAPRNIPMQEGAPVRLSISPECVTVWPQ